MKEIYEQLAPRLEMTYVSLDTMSQAVSWRKLMEEKAIPWRSLLTGERMASVRARYFAYSIPRSLLVYPGGRKMEIIDVRKKEDKAKLFMLVEAQENQ